MLSVATNDKKKEKKKMLLLILQEMYSSLVRMSPVVCSRKLSLTKQRHPALHEDFMLMLNLFAN